MRRRIFRFAVVFSALAFCLSAFCGCHGARGLDPFEIPADFDPDAQYEITFWAKNDTNKTQTKIYESAIASFMALYPNITVNLRLYTDYGRIYNDVITNIATQTTPNVCITYPDHIATYKTGANVVVPLDGLIDDAAYGLGGEALRFDSPTRGELVPSFLSECVIDGVTYALPYMRSTEACYINKTYVEALGYTLPETLTWDFLWEVSEAAMAKGADGKYHVNGQDVMIPFIYKSTDNMMISYLKQTGAGYATADGEIGIFNDTTKDFLYTIASHAATGAFSTFKISSYPANFLNAGQCIFAIDSTAGATWMGTDAPLSDIAPENLVEFETVVMTIPQADPAHPKMISQGPSMCVFNKADPGEVMASWLFAQYLLTNEVQIAYAETEGYVPVTTTAQSDPSYIDYLSRGGEDNTVHYRIKTEASRLLLANTDNTFVTPVYNGSASLRDAAGQLIENVVKSERRHEVVDEAYMEKLFSDVTSLYRLDSREGAVSPKSEDLGPLPETAVALLVSLGAAWCAILVCALCRYRAERKKRRAA